MLHLSTTIGHWRSTVHYQRGFFGLQKRLLCFIFRFDTLLENLKLCPKIVNLNFRDKNWWTILIMIHCFPIRIWIFPPKIVKIQLLFDLYFHKITILAWKFKLYRKILRLKIIKKHCFIPQTLKFTILTFSKNWIFGHNFRFSNSVQFDTQQIRVWIISKLCGSWLVIYFPDRKRLQKQ